MGTMTSRNTCPENRVIEQLRKAAEQGDAESQNEMGFIYVTGKGVPQDFGEALRWYGLSADQEHAEAQFNLGLMYDYGRGVGEDDREASVWYRKAANQGEADAQLYLGFKYANGQGVPKDWVKAYGWLSLAATQREEMAVQAKDFLSSKMTTEQVAEARKLTAELRERIESSKAKQLSFPGFR